MNNANTVKDPKKIDAILKVYPYIGNSENRKGYNIGDIKLAMNASELPFNSFDQVDHTLFNLFNYLNDGKNPSEFFGYHPETISFVPVSNKIEPPTKTGGYKQNRRTIKKNKKSKNYKRKSYKKKQ
jgi:hypothetical protein